MATAPDIIGINALAYYIKRIHTFLMSDKKTLSFPNISQELHNVLVKITEDIKKLNDDKYSDNVKMEAAKLAALMKTHANVKLTYDICDGKFGPNVLMYKKVDVNTFKVPEKVSLRLPNVVTSSTAIVAPEDGNVTQVFKTRCLNAATKFVKDDSQLIMRFPEMLPAQAEFVLDMILPGKDGSENTDVGYGYRSMYAPLWESMRLFGLKYHYNIVYDTRPVTKEGMKRIVFEKIPKTRKMIENESVDITISDDDADTPEVVIVDSDDEDTSDVTQPTPSTGALTTKEASTAPPAASARLAVPKHVRNPRKLVMRIRDEMLTGAIPDDFIQEALRRVADFMMDDQQDTIAFDVTSQYELYFLRNVVRTSATTDAYMLFSSECQRRLDDINYCWNVRRVRYEIVHASHAARGRGCKTYVFKKISSEISETIDLEASDPVNTSYSSKSTTSFSSSEQQKQNENTMQQTVPINRNIRLEKLVVQLTQKFKKNILTEEFVKTTLALVLDFLMDEKQASLVLQPKDHHQTQFIQQFSYIAREDYSHAVFSDECRKLLEKIQCCLKKNIFFSLRQVKKRKDVILEKPARFNKNPVKEDDSDIISLSSVSTTTTNQSASSNKSKKHVKYKIKKRTMKKLNRICTKVSKRTLNLDIDNILKQICDFLCDEEKCSLIFQDYTPEYASFVKVVEHIARDKTRYVIFSSRTQRLLAELYGCFKRNLLYTCHIDKGPNGKKLRLLKKTVPTKELANERENNENVNSTNIANALSQTEQEVLIRLKAIKDKVAQTHGEQSISHYLQDIANFLTRSNTDRTLTFDELSVDEALFVKHANQMSKTEAAYAMFPRECQKLLAGIQNSARAYKLTCRMGLGARKLWTVVIQKQTVPVKEKIDVMERARSLSTGRRVVKEQARALHRDSSVHKARQLDKLKEGLAQPVRSDKALRMMESMGWKGGGLGLRGEGIVEPIALPLEISTRAGLGHVPAKQTVKVKDLKKQKPAKKEPAKKEPVKKEPPKKAPPKKEPLKREPPEADLSSDVFPLSALAADVLPPGILPAGSRGKCKTVVLNSEYRVVLLRTILELVTTAVRVIHFTCTKAQHPPKVFGFLKHAVTIFNGRHRFNVDDEVMMEIIGKISKIFDERIALALKIEIRDETELHPQVAVVRKTNRMPRLPTETYYEVISLIDDDDETTHDLKSTTDDQEIRRVWCLDSTITLESWYEITQAESSRMWYYPVLPKRQQEETMENVVPELKKLALSVVSETGNIGNDAKMKTSNARKIVTRSGKIETIYNDQETTNDGNLATDDQEPTESQVSSVWYQIAESDCQWKFPRESKLPHKQRIAINEIPQLKTLALSAFCKLENIDLEMGNANERTIISNNQGNAQSNGRKINTMDGIIITVSNDLYKAIMNDRKRTPNGQNIITSGDQVVTITSNDKDITSNDQIKITNDSQLMTTMGSDQNIKSNNNRIQTTLCNDQDTTSQDQNMVTKQKLTNCSVKEDNSLQPIKKSKMVLKIPNMTRKHFSVTNQSKEIVRPQRTTYTLEVENYRMNKNILTNVKVSKNPLESCIERKKMKMTNNQQHDITTNSHKQQELTKNIQEQQSLTENMQTQEELITSTQKQYSTKIDEQLRLAENVRLQQNLETTELPKPPGVLLLEKLVINDNDSSVNKNKTNIKVKNTTQSSVSARLINVVADSNVAMEKENKSDNNASTNDFSHVTVKKVNASVDIKPPAIAAIPVTKDSFDVTVKKESFDYNGSAKNNDAPLVNTITPTLNSNASKINNTLIDTETDLICKRIKNMKTAEDKTNANNNGISDSDFESVSYIIPVECKITVDSVTKSNITNAIPINKDNNNVKEKCNNENTCETSNLRKNIENFEDDDSQNEEIALLNDEEIDELANILNNVISSKNVTAKDANENFLKTKGISRKVSQELENVLNQTENDSLDCYNSTDSITKKEEAQSKIIERKRRSPDYPNSTPKKFKLLTYFKKIYIVPEDYPETQMDVQKSREIQTAILKSIDYTQESMPLLKCHGIQNGGLIYSCQDEKSLLFMKNLIQIMDNIKVVHEFDAIEQFTYKMAFRINSYIDEPVSDILKRFELYNSELNSSQWSVIKKEHRGDSTVIHVEIDESSFSYICAVNFVLYAGNDCARFTILWD